MKKILSYVLIALFAASSAVFAGTDTSKVVKEEAVKECGYLKKPVWLKEASITLKESYDTNIYLNNNNVASSNEASWITSVTPKMVFNIIPFIDLDKDDKTVQTFDVLYAPEIVTYHDAEVENYTAHRLGLDFKGKIDDFSYGLSNGFTYIDGRKDTFRFPNAVSAFSTATVRERRDQFQDRLKVFMRYDIEDYFVRPTASLLYYDLHTIQRTAAGANAGYQNYPDRYDVNGGMDFGYKISKDFSTYIGFREGHQEQGIAPLANPAPLSYSNNYERVLFGFEGKPVKWLKVNFEAGPDFRNYESRVPSNFQNSNKTTFYVDTAITAEVTSKDSISFKGKQWQWVASTGRSTYFDRNFELSYTRKVTDELKWTTGGRYLEGDYDAPTNVDDSSYGVFTGLAYTLDEHWSFGLDYAYSRGQNDVDSSITSGRENDDQLVSMSVKWSL